MTAQPDTDLDRALAVLVDGSLDPIVEMVLVHRHGSYEAHAPDGHVRFRREDPADGPGHDWAFTVEEVRGRDPLADTALDRFAPLDAELANRFPDRTRNAYPFAHEQVAQLFDHPAAPDLCVVHTASHHWAEQGGHIGEHGSLASVQCRAPFIVSGVGARRDGMVDVPAQLVDIAPTVLALLGLDPPAEPAWTAATARTPTSPTRTATCWRSCWTPPSGRTTWSGSCSTAATPTSCTTWSTRARPPTSRR